MSLKMNRRVHLLVHKQPMFSHPIQGENCAWFAFYRYIHSAHMLVKKFTPKFMLRMLELHDIIRESDAEE